MKSNLYKGKLKKWNDERGFGFIQPLDGSSDIFLHISELNDATRRPQVNDTIYYYTATDRDGKIRACNAFILGARKKSSSASNSSRNLAKSQAFPVYPLPILKLLLLSIFPLIGSVHFAIKTGNILPLILYPLMSLLTFFSIC